MARAVGRRHRTRVRCFSSFFFLYFSCANAVLFANVAELSHSSCVISSAVLPSALRQGLTLIHFSAQRERFMWDRGCM
jgi:hypothetical protein